jgi:sigma-B regulation protein RsbU (phosphoserine phosphatase)
MGVFTLILILLWALGHLFLTPQLQYRSPYLGLLSELCLFLLIIPAAYYIWKTFKSLRSRLLWKIKRRLVLANIFIGAIPVFMVIAISWFAGLLFYYQFSYYLISNQIGIHSAQINVFSLSLRDKLEEAAEGVSSPATVLKDTLDSDAEFLLSSYQSAIIILHFKDPASGRMITYVNHGENTGTIDSYRIPSWVEESEFGYLVVEDLQPELYNDKRLFLRSFVPTDMQSDLEFSLEVSVPFDDYFLDRLQNAVGQDVLLADRVEVPRPNIVLHNVEVPPKNIIDSSFGNDRDSLSERSGWLFPLFPVSWSEGVEDSTFDLGVLLVEPSAAKLLENMFRSESVIGKRILITLLIIVGVFLIVEILSVMIGILLTRSITRAVQSLDKGTEFVKRGDFGHRVDVQSEDQLGALAASFNQMTEYVQQLVRERVLKERMERELEIAREVQEQLFPERAPQLKHIDVSGVCLPARVVSGDYFDYLLLEGNQLGLAVGDICGKGISAALLMANLQATLRSNAISYQHNGGDHYEITVAEVLCRMNRQMYGYTADNKFATLFYGVYNDDDRTLTYSNAGHNPPLYFEGDAVRRLHAGGTVIGIFADSGYDQETIQLNAGGILVAYTDGIVESVNGHGEEFGEDRLIRLVLQHSGLDAEKMKTRIVEEVLSWTSAEERGDDMTLIVAKIPQGIVENA